MNNLKYKPKVDKLFWIITLPTAALMLALTVFAAAAPLALVITIIADIFVVYFLVSPLFGYVELRENAVFVKFGLLLKREIPYSKIRSIEKARRWYSDSMMSLKCSLDQVNIKYNSFDVTTVSVVDNDIFIAELTARCGL